MKQKKKFSLRIDDELLGKIIFLADHEGRSMNREIEIAIKRYIRDFERLNGEIIPKNTEIED